ncbi:hypothetical protein REPUB_Repub09cG0137000 [Reevesia pubescens]
MDQQGKYSNAADILGSSVFILFFSSHHVICSISEISLRFADCVIYGVLADLYVLSSADDSRIDMGENHLRTQIRKQKNQGAVMPEEEWKIRGELENDIEKDLEEEIKDGIYHLALRLHRLYQHRRERNAQDVSEFGDHKKDKTLSEVNISIKMKGGTKIEIKETKKEAPDHQKIGLPLPPRSSRSNNVNIMQGLLGSNAKKFDWAKSLRAGSDPAIINRKIERSYQAKIPSNDRGFCMNLNLENTRRNLVSASGQRKGNIGLNNKVLELGWKC